MGPDTMILVFWMLSFKPTFSLSSFIKRLFSSSSLPGVICVSEVIDISSSNLDSSLCFIHPSVSHDVLCMYFFLMKKIHLCNISTVYRGLLFTRSSFTLRTICKVEHLSHFTSKELLPRNNAITCGHTLFVGSRDTTFFSHFFPLLFFLSWERLFLWWKWKCSVAQSHPTQWPPWKSPGKKLEWVPPLKINANGPFLFSCWYPLIRWPHPLSCLAITRNWQLPNLQCRVWNPPRSTWPIYTTSASWPRPAEAASRDSEKGGGWCSGEGQNCKSHCSLEVLIFDS